MKSSTINIRIEPKIKEEAEKILSNLGITSSNAIDIFYRQIILKRGLPFEIRLPENAPDIEDMTREEIEMEIIKGINSPKIPIDEAFKKLKEEIGYEI